MLDMMDYAGLAVGETQNGECPTCGKRKFYVTRKPAGYAFICFRASCPTQGFAGSTALDDSSFSREHSPKWARQYAGELFLASEEDIDYFWTRFGVELENPRSAGYWVKVTEDDRYAFPLWGPKDEYRGLVLRRPNWKDCVSNQCPRPDRKTGDYPKTLCYFEENAQARCGWYHSGNESTVVIVEDCVSAMRIASEGYTAVALLGTDFRAEHAQDLQRWKRGTEFVIALDPDAIHKAFGIAANWGPAFPGSVRVAILDEDPKDYEAYPEGKLLEDLGL